jgi:hypothetical protein
MSEQPKLPVARRSIDLTFCSSEEERRLRTRLTRTLNVAADLVWLKSSLVGTSAIYVHAQQVADAWAYRPATVEQLQAAVELVTRLFQAAVIAERLEAADA